MLASQHLSKQKAAPKNTFIILINNCMALILIYFVSVSLSLFLSLWNARNNLSTWPNSRRKSKWEKSHSFSSTLLFLSHTLLKPVFCFSWEEANREKKNKNKNKCLAATAGRSRPISLLLHHHHRHCRPHSSFPPLHRIRLFPVHLGRSLDRSRPFDEKCKRTPQQQ